MSKWCLVLLIDLPRHTPYVDAEVRRAARKINGGLGEVSDLAVSSRGVDRRRDRLKQLLKMPFACPKPPRRVHAFAYIAGDLRSADDPAFSVAHGRNRKRNIDEATVFSLANRLIVMNAFPGTNARYNSWLFVLPVGGNEHRHRPAYGLFCRVTKEPLA